MLVAAVFDSRNAHSAMYQVFALVIGGAFALGGGLFLLGTVMTASVPKESRSKLYAVFAILLLIATAAIYAAILSLLGRPDTSEYVPGLAWAFGVTQTAAGAMVILFMLVLARYLQNRALASCLIAYLAVSLLTTVYVMFCALYQHPSLRLPPVAILQAVGSLMLVAFAIQAFVLRESVTRYLANEYV